ncbi:calmodulin-regulated spectrin-associated protein 1-B isoform X3 [Polypterus senegalus]|uniref:calmodulin-regulated spectrin-associated protein 1-B isoform X3 n=1 Tax=Polypterus senegalus TaxID=55291 RepID=UPI0019646FB9|nr:calmodulin-regulated spectrin-associated protein 1-B isoform X3 [Polypterus senegalus]
MDVDACAAVDGTRRKLEPDGIPEVVPLELYDSARAKIDANLRWLFAKAYGIDNIPKDLRDPFYTDQYEQEHIKPPVIKLLLSSELYCRVCSLILKGDQVATLQGHQSVVQALSRKGIYVIESDDTPVLESDLSSAPIKMSAHIAMIDALMMAYTVEMISIEKVVASVKRFSTFSASKELPFDLEDAMVFWINKVNLKMREITEKEMKVKQHLLESPSHQKSPSKWYWKLVPVRYRRDHLSSRQLPYFPLLEDLMKDVCDGAALLSVIHYYCPELMKLDDICLKEVTSIADNLYNIQLLKVFSNEYLNKSFYLTTEDMLYAPLVLKNNVMVFIAELFWWFEIVKPDFVQPRDFQEVKDARVMLQPKGVRPPIPISNATKRSFMVSPASMSSPAETPPLIQNCPDICNSKSSSGVSPSHPLLPLRQKQQKTIQSEETPGLRHRSSSLTRVDGQPKGSIVAWSDKKQRPLSQPTPYALHFATDSDVDIASGDSISLARSISKDSLASNVIHMTPKQQPAGPRKINGQGLLGNVSIEDEDEEELIAIIKAEGEHNNNGLHNQGDLELQSFSSRATSQATTARTASTFKEESTTDVRPDSFFLEPLMPAILKPAKEKFMNFNKEEEYGEGKQKGLSSKRSVDGQLPLPQRNIVRHKVDTDLNRTFTPISSTNFTTVTDQANSEPRMLTPESVFGPFRQSSNTSTIDAETHDKSSGFFLHCSDSQEKISSSSLGNNSPVYVPEATWSVKQDSDSEVLDMDEVDEDLESIIARPASKKCFEDEESAKLQEDMKVKEHDDKDGASGRSSPCLSTISQASSASMASGSIRMTSFAERKLQRINSHDAKSSTSSSQKTTPDGSESCPPPLTTWRQKREQSPSRQSKDNAHILASELVQLHMQLEEKRRAIEMQKKKMEALSARQRLKLGKAAFLHIVKKGKTDSIPQPLKPDYFAKEETNLGEENLIVASKESRSKDGCSKEEYNEEMFKCSQEVLKDKDGIENKHTGRISRESPTFAASMDIDMKVNSTVLLDDTGAELDINECNRSIEILNDAITNIQQQMMQLSLQQDLLMKQNVQSATLPLPHSKPSLPEQKIKTAVQFTEPLSPTSNGTVRKPPRFGQSRTTRSKPSDLKLSKESKQQSASRVITPTQNLDTVHHLRQLPGSRTPKVENNETSPVTPIDSKSESIDKDTFKCSAGLRMHHESNHRTFLLSAKDESINSDQFYNECVSSNLKDTELNSSDGSGKENIPFEESSKSKTHLIEVDLSDLKASSEDGTDDLKDTKDLTGEGEQKSILGFFFKDDQKAEDELAKKRAAFLLKQQRKAEEARLRKQLLEAEVEQKRDEASRPQRREKQSGNSKYQKQMGRKVQFSRRKAEEDRIRKEEEKARREFIKQEYLRRKQQEIFEEQGLTKPKPKAKPKKQRPKSVHRDESLSETQSKCSSTPDNLSSAQSGSSLSLASAATTEAESVHSGGAASQRGESVESFPILSRNASRNTERDWENASTASSIASVAEYTGPKLFKEPSAKSNKPIIHNAISHCCLAGKVNEAQKNSILEELEKCESNHLIILFRDAGCQFRALYSYFPDTEEIHKLTGTGPKSISKKMIDKLYKYSSDRKQFNVIPAKTVSVSVDALTIHNHLWQAKRPSVPKKSSK